MPTSKIFDGLIAHWTEIERKNGSYPGSKETHGYTAYFAEHFQLTRLGIGHDRLRPGERTSWPHAEADEDEFVFVLEGTPDVWVDGHIKRLKPGDGVGFRSGTGIAHTIINNTDEDVRLLVVGEPSRQKSRINYPLHPKRNKEIGTRHWHDMPKRKLGKHKGVADNIKASSRRKPGPIE
jgi:uncharacterized cupin superfamily protein